MPQPIHGREGTSRAAPSFEEFVAMLDFLADNLDEEAQKQGCGIWVRSCVAMAGTKLRVLRRILRDAPNGRALRLLDVGAQVGALAACAAKVGLEAAAVDYASYAQQFAPIVTPLGVDYRTCDVAREALPFADGSFDWVTYTDVIEHHAFSPRRVLAEIHRVLADGGRILVTTPNHASIYNRLSLLLGRSVNDDFVHYFEACADREFYPGHHREYTKKELGSALERTGFRIEELRVFDEDPGAMLYFLRHRMKYVGKSEKRHAYANFVAAALGKLWVAMRLPFGRYLWAVGEKRKGAGGEEDSKPRDMTRQES